MRYTELMESQVVALDQLPNFEEVMQGNEYKCISIPSNSINSLQGCPEFLDKALNISDQPQLKSLEYAPKKITHKYGISIGDTGITSLKHCPEVQSLSLNANPDLPTLQGCPSTLRNFSIRDCPLIKNFVGGPDVITDTFNARNQNVQSYEGAPKSITWKCTIQALPSMANFDKYFPVINGWLEVHMNAHALPTNMLRILNVQGLKKVTFLNGFFSDAEPIEELTQLFNEYLPQGKRGMMACQTALIKAGYHEQAKL